MRSKTPHRPARTSSGASRIASPWILYLSCWTAALLLYSAKGSDYFTPSTAHAFTLWIALIGSYGIPYFVVWRLGVNKRVTHSQFQTRSQLLVSQPRLRGLWKWWWFVAVAEVATQRSVPLFDYLRGGNGNYLQWGLPSVHGFVLAAGLALSIVSLVSIQGQYRGALAGFVASYGLYCVAIVTRKGLIVLAISCLLVELGRRRLSIKRLATAGLFGFVLVVAFGALGTIRSSSEDSFSSQARLQGVVKDLPTGVQWGYMYLASPFANLINFTSKFPGDESDELVPLMGTFNGLLPSVFDSESAQSFEDKAATNYWLLSGRFNVSTAYASSYRDQGLLGIVILNSIIAIAGASLFHMRRSPRHLPALIVVQTATMLTVFSNNFANLNVVAALPISYLIVRHCSFSTTGLPVSRTRPESAATTRF